MELDAARGFTMAETRTIYNAPDLLFEGAMLLRTYGIKQDSRNGPVVSMPRPTVVTVCNPLERVIFDPVRNANHFFHVMEFIWMMAGSRDVRWISQFNSNMLTYADEGSTINHGAYGHRWRQMFNLDQIAAVVTMLRKDPTTRRAVLGMWDPRFDLTPHNDLPCNTHIYFRYTDDECLDMTVCNRSNDLIWGMAGANIVHMTMLHQLICEAVGVDIGSYHVMTNNLHIYESVPEYDYYMNRMLGVDDRYGTVLGDAHVDLLQGDSLHEFFRQCEEFVTGKTGQMNPWLAEVASPIYFSYMQRKSKKGDGHAIAENIAATDWRLACLEWIERKESAS